MSIGIEYSLKRDGVGPKLTHLRNNLAPQRLNAAVGPAVEQCVKRHLIGLGKNKRGWPSTSFWPNAARATSHSETSEGVLVSINQVGVRQRFHGGHIGPVRARALAIPINPVAYGKVPSDFGGLFLLKTKTGAYLAQAGQELTTSPKGNRTSWRKRDKNAGGNASRRLKGSLNVLFKLSSGVNQATNPNVLPSSDEIFKVASEAVLKLWRDT